MKWTEPKPTNSDMAKEIYAELEAALGKVQQMRGVTDDERRTLKTISNSILDAETRLTWFFKDAVVA